MRLARYLTIAGLAASLACPANAATSHTHAAKAPKTDNSAKPMEVTADQSLEWYQDKHIYVARGNARAVNNDMVIEADLLTAHEREKPADAKAAKKDKAAAIAAPAPTTDAASGIPLPAPTVDQVASQAATKSQDQGTGDIDKMTAEGHVRITTPTQRVQGQHAVYNLVNHTMVVTGDNLKYETEKETVTAKDSLEYYEDQKIAVARGNAVADQPNRHIEGDVLTAEFRSNNLGGNAGSDQLTKMTAVKNVTVITKSDVARGDKAVYDAARDIAIITGHVRITRNDGTELTGDVGETDFKANQSRLLNAGHGRVRALLPQKSNNKAVPDRTAAAGDEQ